MKRLWNVSLDLVADVWNIGSWWLRLLILFLATWPFVAFGVASRTDDWAIKSFVALVPVLGAVVAYVVDTFWARYLDPGLVIAGIAIGKVREGLGGLRKILLYEFVALGYLAFIPVSVHPRWIWPLLLAVVVLALAGKASWFIEHINRFAVPLVVAITVMFIWQWWASSNQDSLRNDVSTKIAQTKVLLGINPGSLTGGATKLSRPAIDADHILGCEEGRVEDVQPDTTVRVIVLPPTPQHPDGCWSKGFRPTLGNQQRLNPADIFAAYPDGEITTRACFADGCKDLPDGPAIRNWFSEPPIYLAFLNKGEKPVGVSIRYTTLEAQKLARR